MTEQSVGRPSIYSPDMCNTIIRLMSEGASKIEVCAELNIARSTLYDWCDERGAYYNPEFSDTIKRGEVLSQSWWERLGRTASAGMVEKFNAPTYIFTLKNRFRSDYADDQNINLGGQSGNPIEQNLTVTFAKPKND